jgi:hypothetical protein
MIGDLLKSASRVALVAVAGISVSGLAAQAADLGGNCCADLEERVAELEATAARKGNRKVSLTVYGNVNEAVIFWNDGIEKNQYVVSNNAARTRFGFRGDAKITSDITAGYLLEIGVRYANSSNRGQGAADGGGNGNAFDIRHSAWYLDSKSLGRVWVGKTSTASDGITEINLANINSGNADISGWNQGFNLRNSATVKASSLKWSALQSSWDNNVGEGDRANVVRYITPTFAGFIASASWSEDDKLDAALRYAGEFSGFRVAAGIGYQKQSDFNNGDGNGGCANPGGFTAAVATSTAAAGSTQATSAAGVSDVNCTALGMSASVMHTPTGLFVTGAYGQSKDSNLSGLNRTSGAASGVVGQAALAAAYTGPVNDKNKMFSIQAGIEQKFFALGKTTIWGEYIKSTTGNSLTGGQLTNVAGNDALLGGAAGAAGTFIASSDVKTIGIGFNQAIDAAAADFYIHARNFSANVNTVNAAGGAVANRGVKDFQAVMTGMIIRF